jgi:tRNA G10  N-methylase Trm11
MKINDLPPLPPKYRYKLDLRKAATPQLLKKHPIHRWFFFPHSYSPELVKAILDRWRLPHGSHILDPFVGAGTTLLVAKERGYSATGFDLSPISLLTSNVKIHTYHVEEIRTCLDREKYSDVGLRPVAKSTFRNGTACILEPKTFYHEAEEED